MILMTKGNTRKFVADALVPNYEKKGFAIPGKALSSSEEVSGEAAEETLAVGEAAEEMPIKAASKKPTARKTKTS